MRRSSRTVDCRSLGGFLEGGSSLTSRGWINGQHHGSIAIVVGVGVEPMAGPHQYFAISHCGVDYTTRVQYR